MIKFIINLFKRKKYKYYFEILKVKPKIKKWYLKNGVDIQ